MRKDDEVVPAPATNQKRKGVATKAAWPGGELAGGGSENGYTAMVALIPGRRKVFWCDREASQPESLCARGLSLKLFSAKIGIDNLVNVVNITNNMAPDYQKPTNATDIGLKLVGHSRATEFSANRGLVIELFPFIFEASQRMSARAISRFLLEEQGVKLSGVTITKALNDPQKSWNLFFDMIEPSARVIAKQWRRENLDFLFVERAKYEDRTGPGTQNALGRVALRLFAKSDFVPADKVLREKWFCINKEIRLKAKTYLESRLAVWVKE